MIRNFFKGKSLIIVGVIIILLGLFFQNAVAVLENISIFMTNLSEMTELSGRGIKKLGEVLISMGASSIMLNISIYTWYDNLLKKKYARMICCIVAVVISLLWVCINDLLSIDNFWITSIGSVVTSMAIMNLFNSFIVSQKNEINDKKF